MPPPSHLDGESHTTTPGGTSTGYPQGVSDARHGLSTTYALIPKKPGTNNLHGIRTPVLVRIPCCCRPKRPGRAAAEPLPESIRSPSDRSIRQIGALRMPATLAVPAGYAIPSVALAT